jgi:hypothetical protein
MKKHIFGIIVIILATGINILAQDIQARLDAAKSDYQSGNLEGARFELQEALNEINQVIGKEILKLLPSEMGGMSSDSMGDEVTGTAAGFAGLYVNREYSGENKNASVSIVSDSPMLAGINTMLTMPAFVGTDENQKRVKVSNYKALLTKDTDDQGIASYDIQVPVSNLLLTFNCTGIADEDEVVEMANTIPVDQIVKLAQ